MDKPKFLYRGVSISAEKFQNLEIHNDIVPVAPPQQNDEGKDIVADGNEYGIYMTTNHTMAKDVYGNTHTSGSIYNPECLFVDQYTRQQRIRYPQVGIVYEIDTQNLAIKKPWISTQLEGHYNNGYGGEEWITTTNESVPNHIIPKESYHITNVVVGDDILNKQINLDISTLSDEQIKAQVVDIIEKRKTGYELFLEQVHTYPQTQRRKIESKMPIYKRLFNAQDGVALNNYSNCDTNNPQELAGFLMQQVYQNTTPNLDLDSLELIIKASSNTSSTEDFSKNIKTLADGLKEKLNNPNVHERVKENTLVILDKLTAINKALNKKLEESQPQIEF